MENDKGAIIDVGTLGAKLVASPIGTLALDLATGMLLRGVVRTPLVRLVDRWLCAALDGSDDPMTRNSRMERERLMIARAILHTFDRLLEKGALAPGFARVTLRLWARALTVPTASKPGACAFKARYGCDPPWVIAVSPEHACNLGCQGCYAGSDSGAATLNRRVLDRVISEAKELWGVNVVVVTGGEPFMYRSEGAEILDIVEKHRDSLFLIFTNGTLIDDSIARRLARLGNATVALSVEGMRETTDARRGPGVFDRVLEAASLLSAHGAAYGISATVTCENYRELMSDNFLDFFFKELNAFYGFLFQYMPVGRDYQVELMPTPRQRLDFWRRSWDVISNKKIFLFDFWNHGTLVHGCVAAGRERGYMHIDWDGEVTPCVFAQHSTGNVNDIFARGGNLNDIWDTPFFRAFREWQREYGYGSEKPSSEANWLIPCPVRDHHQIFRRLIERYDPVPEGAPAREALADKDYYRGLISYGEELNRLSRSIWEQEYL